MVTVMLDSRCFRSLAPLCGLLTTLKGKGVVACLEDWAKSKEAPESFDLLVANGMVEMTGEQLVLTYPDKFTPEAVAGATARLAALPKEAPAS